MKSKTIVFIEAAERPKILQTTSSQLTTCLLRICSFKSIVLLDNKSPEEHPEGPLIRLFSTPTCQTE